MSSAVPVHIYGKRRLRVAKILSILILCVLRWPTVQAATAAAHKTDVELAQALIGTWEAVFTRIGYSKIFLMFNADSTRKGIRITNDHGFPGRTETDGTWRVSHGFLIQQVMKATPSGSGAFRTPFTLRHHIESIENGRATFQDEKGHNDEWRSIGHLPSPPPLITSGEWAPNISAAEVKRMAISTPRPNYPINARARRIKGNGIFTLVLTDTGEVSSIQVLKSTGSEVLDDAAEKALRKWHFKPEIAPKKINVPINFTL
jgi:protein TonB